LIHICHHLLRNRVIIVRQVKAREQSLISINLMELNWIQAKLKSGLDCFLNKTLKYILKRKQLTWITDNFHSSIRDKPTTLKWARCNKAWLSKVYHNHRYRLKNHLTFTKVCPIKVHKKELQPLLCKCLKHRTPLRMLKGYMTWE
jgi:hypothetical protein